jgi:hypothetical protein
VKNLTLTALTAIAKQKGITLPTFKVGTALSKKKEQIIALIEGKETKASAGQTFKGEK